MCSFHVEKNLKGYMPAARTFNEAREQIKADVGILKNAIHEGEFLDGKSLILEDQPLA